MSPRSDGIRSAVRSDPRRAGAVKRWHTWPTIQTQTVAEASWNVARILATIWPHAPAQALTHALLNDCGEIVTGDLPFPVKADNPELKAVTVRLEGEAMMGMGIAHLEAAPADDIWRQRAKIADCLEMWEFGLEELAMGNLFAEPIVEGMIGLIADLTISFDLCHTDREVIEEYITWRTTKTPSRT